MRSVFYLLAGITLLSAFAKHAHKPFTPPGTVRISDTLYIDDAEVSNLAWREYEAWTKQKYGSGSAQHLSTLPDTLIWRDKLAFNEPYVEYYYRHPAYNDYPVTGVSYEQALAYCRWRTERVKESSWVKKNYQVADLCYRLPSKAEWEFCSNNGSNVSWSTHALDSRGSLQVNCRCLDSAGFRNAHMNDPADVTAPVRSYSKNNFGLYNMIGNVAEMVSEKGISKGGGWRSLLEECRPGKDLAYTKPESWLGFRCVCVVHR